MKLPTEIKSVLEQFNIAGTLVEFSAFGHGNINDTYLGTYEKSSKELVQYVHQKINKHVFKFPEIVMSNMQKVTEHIVNKLKKDSHFIEDEYYVLRLIPTKDGNPFICAGKDDIWRTTNYLKGLVTYESLETKKQAFEAGKCLGEFHMLLADFDVAKLGDSLPDFHHTEKYFKKFMKTLNEKKVQNKIAKSTSLKKIVQDLAAREELAYKFFHALENGTTKPKTVHNDPKINNFMFNPISEAAVCMIDLDTVKPGLIHYDFGDCVRSAANPLGEETQEFDKVHLELEFYDGIASGYCEKACRYLSKAETLLLVESPKIIAFELSMRFLTSYLAEDKYFKEKYPEHNLDRAIVQYQLMRDMEKKEPKLKELVIEYMTMH